MRRLGKEEPVRPDQGPVRIELLPEVRRGAAFASLVAVPVTCVSDGAMSGHEEDAFSAAARALWEADDQYMELLRKVVAGLHDIGRGLRAADSQSGELLAMRCIRLGALGVLLQRNNERRATALTQVEREALHDLNRNVAVDEADLKN